jgi:hypothetical protein
MSVPAAALLARTAHVRKPALLERKIPSSSTRKSTEFELGHEKRSDDKS